ncbi:MAG: hypothetical protein K2Y26_16215 [Gemmatimonadaceae bacterium]|jgi:hypothetical protein|nr:hypothetical protein [Gemmatimonadaceae bacterium]
MGSSPRERKGNKYQSAQNGTPLGVGIGVEFGPREVHDFVLIDVHAANLGRTNERAPVERIGDGAGVKGSSGRIGDFSAADLLTVRRLGLRRGVLIDKSNAAAPIVRMKRRQDD